MNPPEPDELEQQAAVWIARRDRGLSAQEQDRLREWLSADEKHRAALDRLSRLWDRMDALTSWRPAHSARVNPDLLLPARRQAWWARTGTIALLSAAAITMALLLWPAREIPAETTGVAAVVPAPERRTLEDGSIVELNAGAAIDSTYSPEVRRVRLLRGEALFTVAGDPSRPFVVEAGGFSVRALGTVFCVAAGTTDFSVLVTEGQVQVGRAGERVSRALIPTLAAGHQATIAAVGEPRIAIREVTPAEVDAYLAWRAIRLVFEDVPLREVVQEFNRFNVRRMVVADANTGSILVGGTFRADHLDAFVRLLDSGFGVTAVSRGDDILLQRRP